MLSLCLWQLQVGFSKKTVNIEFDRNSSRCLPRMELSSSLPTGAGIRSFACTYLLWWESSWRPGPERRQGDSGTSKDVSRPGIEPGSQQLASCGITSRPPQHDTTGPCHRAFDVFQGSCYTILLLSARHPARASKPSSATSVTGIRLESGTREETGRLRDVKDVSRPGIEPGSQQLASCAITARPLQHDTTGLRHRAFDVFQGSNLIFIWQKPFFSHRSRLMYVETIV